MKKIILGSLLISGVLVSNTPTFAETTTNQATTAEAQSDALIELTKVNEDDKPPLVSEDPKPEEPGTNQTGEFTIDLVPKFDFGKVTVAGGEVKLSNDKVQAVQVSDRRADKEGWQLKVQLGNFENTEEGATWKSLNGATIKSEILGDLLTTEGNINAQPGKKGIVLDAGGEADILMETSDTAGSGKGSWMGYFADGTAETKTSLTVPAGNYAGNYKAVMTWTLSATQD